MTLALAILACCLAMFSLMVVWRIREDQEFDRFVKRDQYDDNPTSFRRARNVR